MITVTLDEITLNAVKAALDERIARLETAVIFYQRDVDDPWMGVATEDAQRALVWSIAALHESKLAREYLSDPEVDHPADATLEQSDPITAYKGWSESEMRAAAGDR